MLSYFPKSISSIIKKFNKSSIWFKTLSIIVLGLIITLLLKSEEKENFVPTGTGGKKFVVKQNSNLYDEFYASIYDELVYDPKKNEFEITAIQRHAAMDANSNVLDIGCGTGHHVYHYQVSGIKIQGLDKSKPMTQVAEHHYPDCEFKIGDVLKSNTYDRNQFTHALCLYYTIYYMRDKALFFKNVYDWLRPGGTLVIHLVNRNMFDPIILAGDPLVGVSAQKHAPKRITNSVAKFNNFTYKANFHHKKGENVAIFKESFKDDKTKHVRQNEHTLYMETQKEILGKAKQVGFIMKGQMNMVEAQYEYQYLYFLQKPN